MHLRRALIVASLALVASACGRQPSPAELAVAIVDDPYDLLECRSLGVVSPVVTTTPGFAGQLESMLQETMARGGTDLYLDRRSQDWLAVRGVAYRCNRGLGRDWVVVRRAG